MRRTFNGPGWYSTEYQVQGRAIFGDELWAPSRREAKILCRKRGRGERLFDAQPGGRRSYPPASKLWNRRKRSLRRDMESLHAIANLLDIASAAGVTGREATIGDQGVLHEAITFLQFEGTPDHEGSRRSYVYASLRKIERLTPGYLSPRDR